MKEIKSFDDFLSKFKTFLFCYNKIQPTFCLETSHMYYYNFTEGYSEKQLNQDIIKNSDMFDWEKTTLFYYPNTNMFSGDNSEYNISGYEVRLKKRKKETTDNTYNGWKNRQTWSVSLWILNDEYLYLKAREFMKTRKSTKRAYSSFVRSMGMEDDRTPDNIKYISARLCYAELDEMMKGLI